MARFCVDVVFSLLVVIFLGGVGFWGDWERGVEHDVVDGVFFCSVLVIMQVVCV